MVRSACIAALAVTATPVMALPCATTSNKDVLAHLEKNSGETVRFVGEMSTGEAPIPMGLTVSDDGTFTILVLTSDGTCFVAVGVNWQAVEQKPAGVEN
jgi:hypothetical protein